MREMHAASSSFREEVDAWRVKLLLRLSAATDQSFSSNLWSEAKSARPIDSYQRRVATANRPQPITCRNFHHADPAPGASRGFSRSAGNSAQ